MALLTGGLLADSVKGFGSSMVFIAARLRIDGRVLDVHASGLPAVPSHAEVKLWQGPWWVDNAAVRAELEALVRRAVAGEESRCRAVMKTVDGPVPIDLVGSPIRDPGANVSGVSVLGVSPGTIDQAESVSETTRLKLAIDAAELGLFDLNAATGRIWVDGRTRSMLGLPLGLELTMARCLALLDPRDVVPTQRGIAEALRSRSGGFALVIRVAQPGRQRPGVLRIMGRVMDSHSVREPQPSRVVGVVRDVTQDYAADIRARQNQERLSLALQALRGVIYEWDLQTGEVVRSGNLQGLIGWEESQVPPTAEWWAMQVHPDDMSRARQHHRETVEARGERMDHEYRIRRRDGRWIWVWDHCRIFYGPAGDAVRVIGCTVSIDDRKAAELERERLLEELRFQSDQLELAQTAGGVGVWAWNVQTDVSEWSATSAQMYGFGDAAITRGNGFEMWSSRLHPGDRDRVLRGLEAILASDATSWRDEFRLSRPDGEIVWIETTAQVSRDQDGRALRMMGVNVDITRRKRLGTVLRENERRFRAALENSAVVVFEHDLDLRYTWLYNPRMPDFGEGMQGRTDHDVLDRDEADALVELKRRALSTATAVVADVAVTDQRTGKRYWWHARFEPIFESGGQVSGLICSAVDITDHLRLEHELRNHRNGLEELVRRRSEELRQANDRLRVADRLASIGQLATGLGHDLSNLLVPMRMRLRAMASSAALPSQLREDVDALQQTCLYLSRLAGGLRLFTKSPETADDPQRTYLGPWLGAIEPFLRAVLPPTVALETLCSDAALTVPVEPPRLTQAVYNLVQNAADAMRTTGGGTVQISVHAEANRAVITVSDTGPGMTPEVAARCMEENFSTRSSAASLGIGLTLVRSIVTAAGGTMGFSTELGRGTLFWLNLPTTVKP